MSNVPHSVDEPSGTHAQPRQTVDLKTVAIILACILGIPGTGVATSLIGGSAMSGDVAALTLEVKTLGAKLDKLDKTVDELDDTVADIRQDKRADAASFEVLRGRIQDHEDRLRLLESKRGR